MTAQASDAEKQGLHIIFKNAFQVTYFRNLQFFLCFCIYCCSNVSTFLVKTCTLEPLKIYTTL